jgi:mxaJ protein
MKRVLLALALVAVAPAYGAPAPALRVCAEPGNMPLSNERGEGLENRLARLVAADLHERLEVTWWAQRRGYLRHTLKAHKCDVILGVPADADKVLTTRPYYRSTYVFVTRADAEPITSFDDERLRTWRVGVPLVGDDGANPPPVHALSARGIVDNLVGFHVYAGPLVPLEALAQGKLDVAIAWGPFAGWYVRHARVPLRLTPTPSEDRGLPMTFAIAMGVRKDDQALRERLDAVLVRRRADIERLLDDYGVPR